MNNNFRKYMIFWISQSVSQLGSAMTSFALILWAYTISNSVFSVSMMLFCNYVPYIIASLFAGAFVDRHSKKIIMLVSDSIAAAGSGIIFAVSCAGGLQLWHIYLVNGMLGFMNAFQSPASSVAIGGMVPKDKIASVSGMNSFSGNLIVVLAPALAAALYAWGGLKVVLAIDLVSFAAAFLALLFLIPIPETRVPDSQKKSVFCGCREGFVFLRQRKGIFMVILTMALLNFFSRMTYENILSPMILSRSGNNSAVLGIVNAVTGIGGIAGGMMVSTGKLPKDSIKMIYFSAAASFLFGDLLMGVGRNAVMWSIAGAAASLPIPFINAGQNVILYRKVPCEMQGRIFSIRNAIQYSTIPIGILMGGFLADSVFEPFMASGHAVTSILHFIVGSGTGSGMAVMFLCTGLLGSIFSGTFYCRKELNELRD